MLHDAHGGVVCLLVECLRRAAERTTNWQTLPDEAYSFVVKHKDLWSISTRYKRSLGVDISSKIWFSSLLVVVFEPFDKDKEV